MMFPRLRTVLCGIINVFLCLGVRILAEENTGIWFVIEPVDLIAVAGTPATLHCTAGSAISVPIVRWTTFDGTILSFIDDPHRTQLSNGSLHILRVQGNEEHGIERYRCLATVESIGSIVSRTATITVAKLPPLEHQPEDLRVYPTQTAHFVCHSPGKPPPTVTWFKDQRPLIIDETRMLLLPSGSLEIDDVQLSDAGIYRCNVSGLDRHRTSEKAFLSVDQDLEAMATPMAPLFIATPKSTVTLEGKTVTLDCAANGIPKPWITWLKDGVPIDLADLDSRFRTVGTGSLQISRVVESDAGTYQCRAGNKEDSLDAQATLHVQVAPRFLKKPQSVVAVAKSDIELECEVYGRPEPSVSWVKNGEVIPPNHYLQVVNGNNLRILGVMEQDFGIFQCVASNPAGNMQSAALLTVTSPGVVLAGTGKGREHAAVRDSPRGTGGESGALAAPPRELEAAIVKPRFVTLRWKPPAHAPQPVLLYRVFYRQDKSERERVVNTSRSRLEEANIAGLLPNTTYLFRVAAVTAGGAAGALTPTLTVVTVPELHVPGAPQVVSAVADTSTITVAWQVPAITNGPILHYKLYYFESETSEEHHVDTKEIQYTLSGLKRFTEYIVWVVAFNHNGGGPSSQEITLKTLSDVPSAPPTNVSVEPDSSTSVTVRWEPPPAEERNGIITGYKLRYRKKSLGRGGAETVTTAGNKRFYSITGLEKGSSYQVRVWAMTVNGTGPPTEWYTIETYENDLDESTVPDKPKSMAVKAGSNSITVMWTPPENPNIMVREYYIGWGKGIPDEYQERVDSKQRLFVIKDLESLSEYVISVRAHNERGFGEPIYETTRTVDESTLPVAESPPLTPPVGLKATVLSASSVVLFWTDTTLPLTQYVTDSRYYVVRYSQYHPTGPLHKYKYYNSTVFNFMLDDLKPHTQYEFAVKLVKGRRESSWSMMVVNTTMEAAPGSPCRDLTVKQVEKDPASVLLHWQPPKLPNGIIIGYLISYSKDKSSKEWATHNIESDTQTTTISSLDPEATYHFFIQARNSKGLSPNSHVISHKMPADPGFGFEFGSSKGGGGALGGMSLIYVAAGCGALVSLCIAVVIIIICCRKRDSLGLERSKYMKGSGGMKPPDLWIHHDQMELKALEKQDGGGGGSAGSLPRDHSSSDLDDSGVGGSKHHYTHSSTGTGGGSNSYMGSQCQPLLSSDERSSIGRRATRTKPTIALPMDNSHFREPVATATPLGGASSPLGGPDRMGPLYPAGPIPSRPSASYSLTRAHVTIDTATLSAPGESPYVVGQVSYEQLPGGGHLYHQQPPVVVSANQSPHQPVYSSGGSSSGGSVAIGSTVDPKRLQGHPLKSFSVPAPPPQSAPSTPQQKHMAGVRGNSPYKGKGSPPPSIAPQYSTITMSPKGRGGALQHCSSSTADTGDTSASSAASSATLPTMQPSYSTEELNQEMANLEGLMKDLNAITCQSHNEYQC